jgi:hypothetical protein
MPNVFMDGIELISAPYSLTPQEIEQHFPSALNPRRT